MTTEIEVAQRRANAASWFLKRQFGEDEAVPEIGIILGTGWGDALNIMGAASVPFKEIPGFDGLQPLEGHARRVWSGEVAGKRIIALQGRIHLNEHPSDPRLPELVRLQVQMLLELGVRKFILTNAVGSLKHECKVGDLVIADGLVTLFAPPMPLYAGEFCSPEDRLDRGMRANALDIKVVKDGAVLLTHSGGYAMVRGPFFEGRKYDKYILRNTGAMTVGMSLLPELCTIALYPSASAVCLSFITNTMDEEHSHETNQTRAKQSSALLGEYLERLIEQI
ncbi:MAG: hypothetical protein PHC70_00430 [Patescibacteria group bacterium]|nr:hypothetical protein [Patescibacteria group bacterium]